jgi:tetratricopeptide (TPR) repeat protein
MGRTRSLEREFLAERLRRIEDFLSDTREYELAKKGLTRYPDRFQPDDFLRRLEADLLLKLLAETEEGKVEKAIKSWRRALSAQLRKHKEFYRLAACRREKQDGIKNNFRGLNRLLISANQA